MVALKQPFLLRLLYEVELVVFLLTTVIPFWNRHNSMARIACWHKLFEKTAVNFGPEIRSATWWNYVKTEVNTDEDNQNL